MATNTNNMQMLPQMKLLSNVVVHVKSARLLTRYNCEPRSTAGHRSASYHEPTLTERTTEERDFLSGIESYKVANLS